MPGSQLAFRSLRSLRLAALILCLGATAAEELDFGFPNEPTVRDKVELVRGQVTCKVPLHWYNIAQFSVAAKNAIASVGVVSTPVLLNTYQFMKNFGINPAELHLTYFVLPHGAAPEQVAKKIDAARSGTFQELLSWQVKQNPRLAHIDTTTWEVEMDPPTTTTTWVQRPLRIPLPPQSQTEALAEALHNSGTSLECESAETACICAAMDACAWTPSSASGAQGEFVCTEAAERDAPTDVPCAHCAIQTHCPQDPTRMCGLQTDACRCALSRGDCFWDSNISECVPRQVDYTPCSVCPEQGRCGNPVMVAVSPAAGSVLGEPTSATLEMRFDRRIQYAAVEGDFAFQCFVSTELGSALRTVPSSLLQVEGRVLRIFAAGMQNAAEVDCHLMIHKGAVRDENGLLYGGMLHDQYHFVLGDTIAPTLAMSSPRNDEVVSTFPSSLRLNFSEPVRLSSAFFAELVLQLPTAEDKGQSPHRSLAMFDGPLAEGASVNQSFLTLDLTGVAEPGLAGSRYSLRLPAGAVVDHAGNALAALGPESYGFRTSVAGSALLVRFSLTIENLDYEMLASDRALYSEVEVAVREGVADSGGPAVAPENVEVELSAGSVVAGCSVAVADSMVAEAVQAQLRNASSVAEAVVTRLAEVVRLPAVSTGPLGVSEVQPPAVVDNVNGRGVVAANRTGRRGPWGAVWAIWLAALIISGVADRNGDNNNSNNNSNNSSRDGSSNRCSPNLMA